MIQIPGTTLFLALFLTFVLGFAVAQALWRPLCEKWEARGDRYFWKWFHEA